MAANPRQKSLELPAYIRRTIPNWQTPQWLQADRWRRVVRSQPVAIICRDNLITYLQALPWKIQARDQKESEELKPDIDYYTRFVLAKFDELMDKVWQDALDLPIGGNLEILRWNKDVMPRIEQDGEEYYVTRPHPRGHVFKLIPLDGATLYPTYSDDIPLAQKLPEDVTARVYFRPNEIGRILMTPRPELRLKGYGMPPPERIYLAISLLYRGDQYYANMLLDTPPAGILDVVDFSPEDMAEWLQSFRATFEGVDPFKIPVLYDHEQGAAWIPFGRPPTEMMFDAITLKYARITASGYWLTLTHIGLEPKGDTLAGKIREDVSIMRTGYGIVKEKTRNLLNNSVLPPYLEWLPEETTPEHQTQKGRAFLLYAQSLKASKEAGFIKAPDGQAELIRQGFLTVEVEPIDEDGPIPEPTPGKNGKEEADEIVEKVPPVEGGRGDITSQADLGDAAISAVPQDTTLYDQLAQPIAAGFFEMRQRATRPRMLKLVKAAVRLLFPKFEPVAKALADDELPVWLTQRMLLWFDQPSEFDDVPDVKQVIQANLDDLDEVLEKEDWWRLSLDMVPALVLVYKMAFSEGAIAAAQAVREFLYTEGLADSPDIVGFSFDLVNPRTISQLETRAADLVREINDGTKYYLKRTLTSGVEEGLSSPKIAGLIREGAGVEQILKEGGFAESIIKNTQMELGHLSEARVSSIVNTEINRSESQGRMSQWREMGLTQKQWVTAGNPCPICLANEELGLVPMDYIFEDVFGGTETPPGHPGVCRCHLEFSEQELVDKSDKLEFWDGS